MDELKENFPLKEITTVGIGGLARFFVEVKTKEQLIEALKFAKEKNIPYLIIGGGSNLLISDEGYPGLIIKNGICGIDLASPSEAWKARERSVIVKSGTILQNLVDLTIQKGLFGLQKLTGIPGTLGGAIYGNAGAYGQTISDYLLGVPALDPQTFQVVTLSKNECGFGYRDSNFKRNGLIILEANFQLDPANPKTLAEESAKIISERSLKYPPALKCPGSFFKNILADEIDPKCLELIPAEKITYGKIPAGYLLEAVGAKGERLGDVEVSSTHANLLINLREGTSDDFYKLAKELVLKVKDKFGIILEPEVQLINLPKLWS